MDKQRKRRGDESPRRRAGPHKQKKGCQPDASCLKPPDGASQATSTNTVNLPMKDYDARIASFVEKRWLKERPTKEDLAEAGFWYTG